MTTARRTGPTRSAQLELMLVYAAAAVLAVSPALAQVPVAQDGRLLDANPQLGSGGINYAYPGVYSGQIGGNPFATGNVRGGMSLHAFSPITAPNAFRGGLGSGSLSNFIRDSVGVTDRPRPLGGLAPQRFYDPVQSVPSASYLSGFYNTGEVAGLASPLSRSLDSSYDSQRVNPPAYGAPPTPAARYAALLDAETTYGIVPDTGIRSTLFGPQAPRLPQPLSDPTMTDEATYLSPELFGEDGLPLARGASDGVSGPLDMRMKPEYYAGAQAAPLSVLIQDDATHLLTDASIPNIVSTDQPAATRLLTPDVDRAADGDESADTRLPLDPTMLPGNNLFTDMRLALSLEDNMDAEWFDHMKASISQDPVLALESQEQASVAAGDFVDSVLASKIDTFVGDGESELNRELLEAEASMELGHYYEASQHFDRASVFDAASPLPLVGKAHALLGAGEYVSAAAFLASGLERFPELTRFDLDLTTLMGGGEIVDIRRSDLMKQLERNETPELRFLLGYLEFYTGNREVGLRNLEQAAMEDTRPGSIIRRYPKMLRGSRAASPTLDLPTAPIPATTSDPSPTPSE